MDDSTRVRLGLQVKGYGHQVKGSGVLGQFVILVLYEKGLSAVLCQVRDTVFGPIQMA